MSKNLLPVLAREFSQIDVKFEPKRNFRTS